MPDESGYEPADAAYQGSAGAYSESAAWALLGERARLLPCETLQDVFDAVEHGRARRAVVPIENSLAGAVPGTSELLIAHDCLIAAESIGHIDHVLAVRPGTALARLQRVLSHPVALAQCTRFFRERRSLSAVPVFDTAGAVPMALDDGTGTTAAIASRRAAALHGADVILERFQDHADNWTRFVLAVPRREHVGVTGWPRKALVACRLRHEPGALARALRPFADRGLNLTRIESRPIHHRPFEYLFLLEAQADSPDQRLTDAIDEAAADAAWMRVLGVFEPDLRSGGIRAAAAGPPAAS